MTLSNIKGIIFDLGYTLIEYKNRPWPGILKESTKAAWQKLKDLDIDLPELELFSRRFETIKEEYRRAAYDSMMGWKINRVVESLLDEFGVEQSTKYSNVFIETFYAVGRDQMYVPDENVETLKTLKNSGYRTGIISNTIYPGYLHDFDISCFGLMPFLDFRIYSSELGRRKPHPEIFREGIKRIDLKPEEIMYIGDRFEIDGLGCRKAGMIPVIKLCRKEEYPDPFPSDIHAINNIPELLILLNKVGS